MDANINSQSRKNVNPLRSNLFISFINDASVKRGIQFTTATTTTATTTDANLLLDVEHHIKMFYKQNKCLTVSAVPLSG